MNAGVGVPLNPRIGEIVDTLHQPMVEVDCGPNAWNGYDLVNSATMTLVRLSSEFDEPAETIVVHTISNFAATSTATFSGGVPVEAVGEYVRTLLGVRR